MPPRSPAAPSRGRIGRVRDRVQDWFARGHRDLPWRRTRDPYAIWISETMLQQTRVDTVIPYYERFLDRFPGIDELASASQDEVFASWAGLGYYRRAANLHRAAAVVRDRHGGEMPADEEALLALPGVGRYTAGAVRSLAFGHAAPVLDGNVSRVLSRVFGLEGPVRDNETRLWELAGRLVAGSRPSHLNQGLMELGATVCTPRAARCDACPLSRLCEARRRGATESIPAPAARKAVPTVRRDVVVLRRGDGRVLLLRRAVGGLWSGLWDLPAWDEGSEAGASAVTRRLEALLGCAVGGVAPVPGRRTHLLTHRRLDVRTWTATHEGGRIRLPEGHTARAWVAPGARSKHGTSRLVRDVLDEIAAG